VTSARRPRCADLAGQAGDPLEATAPPAERWLLVEHPGPWGRHAITESRLHPVAAKGFARWTQTHRSRVALIRRPGRSPQVDLPRRWFLVDCRPGREAVHLGWFTDEAALVDILAEQAPGTPSTEPIYLVCAHGRHDTCCALHGRPVAAALAERFPERAWECTHVGGDRFAANLVLLPHGLYYGQVTPRLAVDLVERYARGELHPALLRGRSSLTPAAQAAQHHARLATGELGIDALPVLSATRLDATTWAVLLDGGPSGAPITVTVRSRVVDAGRPLTCSDTQHGRYRTFDLVGLSEGSVEYVPATG
jgi:Sucrase/ferredoxin-like